MTVAPQTDVTPPVFKQQVRFAPHRLALIAMWLVSTTVFVVLLLNGVRTNRQYLLERDLLQGVYVLALFWYLFRAGPPVSALPDLPPVLLPGRWIGRMIPVIAIVLLFTGAFLGIELVLLLVLPATLWILIAWRREITLRAVLLGLAVTALALVAGLPFYQNRYISAEIFFLFVAFVPLIFVGGGLLNKRTGLVGSQLYHGRFKQALVSFLTGCLLFVPLGLANAAAGSPGAWMTWVDHAWQPFIQPFFSGIVEEAWWRLLVVSLCYFLLRPAFNRQPTLALLGAVFFSGILHGLDHGGTLLERVLVTGLLFLVPVAGVFARRDWEHSIGAHYMINMIPTLLVFLEG